ncbi:MAG: Fructose-bisphosphate aldolase [Streblomastix strix]|uniref:fructose-bisphosphate aldolase n=1 Tax=Streblomastix strix TaxID=222440 RepID=A0A5J4WHR1_9EUKA|nr:MAG: Fructose-bisphosphate aldolase [Streblomastix strix]
MVRELHCLVAEQLKSPQRTMPYATLKQVLDEARKGKYALGAFNVNNMEQVQAIVNAAVQTKSPVIIQCSRGAIKYSEGRYLKHLIDAALELHPEIPIVLHLDHGDTLESAKQAIALGFTSVMIDASHFPYEENVRISKSVVDYAHPFGVSVEAEIGTIGGVEEDIRGEILLTDADQAAKFVAETGVDALAVAIGTSHGAYKFKETPHLAIGIVQGISDKTQKPLVMHGSSSVPEEILDQINKYGGKMPNAKGVPIDQIQQAISHGVTKVNVDTDSRMAMTAAIRKIFVEEPQKFDLRDYLGPGRDAITKITAEKMKAFGCAGHAGDYAVISLDKAKKDYYKL